MSPGNHQDLWEDQAIGDVSGSPAAPEPLLPHPANQHQDRAADVCAAEEPFALEITSITNEEAGRPQSPGQQVRFLLRVALEEQSQCHPS